MGSSVATIIVREGRVLVARRDFGGALGGLWEFPGGKLEEGETEAAALEREFLEEFGAAVRATRPLGEAAFMHKGKDRRLVAWLAELPGDAHLELHEHLALKWASREELEDLDLAPSDRLLFPHVLPLLG